MALLPLNIPSNIDKYFYNRTKDLKLLNNYISNIQDDIPVQLLVTGYRGVGKSFLLKKLLKEQPNQILTSYLDLSRVLGKYHGELSESIVLKELLNQLNTTIANHSTFSKIKQPLIQHVKNLPLKSYDFTNSTEIFNIPLPDINDNYSKLSEFTMQLPQKIVDSSKNIDGFIIIIDEFQLLKKLNDPESFFWLLRSFSQTQDNVSYIFTGSISKTSDIIEMINGQTGAFGGRMVQVNIDPFTFAETENYIKEKTNLKFTKDGFERFYKCTRGIPAYINSFANVLDANEEYDEELIKENFVLKIDQIAVMWLRVWGTLTDKEKEIVKEILNNEQQNLSGLIDSTGYSKGTVIKYLEFLQNKGIVDYINKDYEISDKMLKSWLNYKKDTDGYFPD